MIEVRAIVLRGVDDARRLDGVAPTFSTTDSPGAPPIPAQFFGAFVATVTR